MKITKYPNRYTISLSPAEFDMLKELVGRAKVDFADESQLVTLSPKMRVKLRSHRWALIGGPLTVDVEKSRRGGKPTAHVDKKQTGPGAS